MPSTVVHVAFGGLIAAALLGREFDRRSLVVVLAFAALPDLDTLLGIYVLGGHRALLHNAFLPLVLGTVLYLDARHPESIVRGRWGVRGVRIGAVSLVALAFAGIAPDLLTNGVNLFYPVYDRFFTLDGHLLLSNERGVVQTFVEFHEGGGQTAGGTTQNTHYYTGFDAQRGQDPKDVERVFPLVQSGMELLIVVLSAFTVGGRFWDERETETETE